MFALIFDFNSFSSVNYLMQWANFDVNLYTDSPSTKTMQKKSFVDSVAAGICYSIWYGRKRPIPCACNLRRTNDENLLKITCNIGSYENWSQLAFGTNRPRALTTVGRKPLKRAKKHGLAGDPYSRKRGKGNSTKIMHNIGLCKE